MSATPGPQSASPTLIEFDRVSKAYRDGTVALDGVTARFERGSFVSLVGPSGCGKSTFLRLVAGLAAPSAGHIRWHGQSSAESAAQPGDIGFVFQDATLLPWASVFDNVWLPLKLQGTGRAEAGARVRNALERVGLGHVAHAFPRELSGGMRMRVSIARALVTEPPVLLMDEPFAALDENIRERLEDDLVALWREQGWTVIFVTHSVYESVYLSERVLVMGTHPGRLMQEIGIDAPYPRGRAFRESALYMDRCHAVSAALRGSAAL